MLVWLGWGSLLRRWGSEIWRGWKSVLGRVLLVGVEGGRGGGCDVVVDAHLGDGRLFSREQVGFGRKCYSQIWNL